MRFQMVTIYRNKMTGEYVIQPMARHPLGGSAEYGEPIKLSEADFDRRIVDLVRENMRRYEVEEFDESRARKFSDAEYSRFIRDHDSVTITHYDSGLMKISVGRRVQGGYVSDKATEQEMWESEIQQEMGPAIREAFGISP